MPIGRFSFSHLLVLVPSAFLFSSIYFHPLSLLCLWAMCQVSQPSTLTAPQTNIRTDKPLTEGCEFIKLFSQFVYINNATLLMCALSCYLRSVSTYVIPLWRLAKFFWGNLVEMGYSLFLVISWPSQHAHRTTGGPWSRTDIAWVWARMYIHTGSNTMQGICSLNTSPNVPKTWDTEHICNTNVSTSHSAKQTWVSLRCIMLA